METKEVSQVSVKMKRVRVKRRRFRSTGRKVQYELSGKIELPSTAPIAIKFIVPFTELKQLYKQPFDINSVLERVITTPETKQLFKDNPEEFEYAFAWEFGPTIIDIISKPRGSHKGRTEFVKKIKRIIGWLYAITKYYKTRPDIEYPDFLGFLKLKRNEGWSDLKFIFALIHLVYGQEIKKSGLAPIFDGYECSNAKHVLFYKDRMARYYCAFFKGKAPDDVERLISKVPILWEFAEDLSRKRPR